MIRRLTSQFPAWARMENPALRYALGAQRPFTWRSFLALLILVGLVLASVVLVNLSTGQDFGQSLSEQLINVLFWPMVGGQLALSITVILYTTNVVSAEKRRQTWDKVRTTGSGASLTLRAQWSAAVFYRAGTLMAMLYLLRLILVGALVFDLTAFRGDYLAYLTGPVTPEIPVVLGVLLLALTMTASFVLPLTGLGLDAAVGLLASTFVSQRFWVAMVQIILVIARIALTGGMIVLALVVLDNPSGFVLDPAGRDDTVNWLVMLGFGAFGDWGTRFLHLGFLGDMWALLPWTVFLGLGLLLAALLQALLTDGLLALAVRRAERRE